MTLVERIQALCSSRNTTLIGLEREIGLGRGTIRNWDKNSPAIDKVIKVARYFNVGIEEILGERLNVDLSEKLRLLVMELSQGPYGNRIFRQELVGPLGKNLESIEEKYTVKIPLNPQSLIELCHEKNSEDFAVDVLRALEEVKNQTMQSTETNYVPETIAAHHDGEDWTEEELQDIEEFKELVKLRRQLRKNKE